MAKMFSENVSVLLCDGSENWPDFVAVWAHMLVACILTPGVKKGHADPNVLHQQRKLKLT